MSKKSGTGKFLGGALLGVTLGVLFAPKKGSETRKELKAKFEELVEAAREIDIDEVKLSIEDKLEEIKYEMANLDKEKVLKIAKKKANELKEQAEDLVAYAVEKGSPVLEKAAEEVKEQVIKASKAVISKLEKPKN